MNIIVLSSYAFIRKVNNYGSLLQYFALQTFLEKEGFKVKWLKYEAKKNSPKGLNKWLRKQILKSNFKVDEVTYHNKEGFDKFIDQYIKLTDKEYLYQKELYVQPPQADLYIVGSDQVWNGYSPDRYLTFVPKNIPRISYAVSFGKNKIPWYMKPLLRYYLRNFKAISIREIEGVNLCHSLGHKEAKYTIDPSFLLQRDDYIKIIKTDNSITSIKAPYIYGYFVNPFPNDVLTAKEAINEFINHKGLNFFVTGIQNAERALHDYINIQPSPLAWINNILNADCILTNSFHGVAFSINLHKKFLLILQTGEMSNQNCRYLNLLNKLSIEDRIYDVSKGNMLSQMEKAIDWESVDKKLYEFTNESKTFLIEAIKSCQKVNSK